MAHDPARTEKATPKRRQKAREEGSVLRSPDLDATILLWGNLFLFSGVWGATFMLLAQQLSHFLRLATQGGWSDPVSLGRLGMDVLSILLRVLLPYLGLNLLLGVGLQLAQHGFKLSTKALMPKPGKLNPASGLKRLFSPRSVVELLKSAAKLAVLAWVAYGVLAPRMGLLTSSLHHSLGDNLHLLQTTLFLLFRNVMIAMLVLAALDYLYQRQQFEKGLRMTKQEVKDEMKDAEGSPQVKGRQRSLMLAAVMHRITTQVPKASVVITNPTHFAVALRYEQGSAAPVCVAKGVDHLALKIREKAKESGVPVVENRPLARALYRQVDLDQAIPQELYQAVAQVLAYVYRLRGVA